MPKQLEGSLPISKPTLELEDDRRSAVLDSLDLKLEGRDWRRAWQSDSYIRNRKLNWFDSWKDN